MEVAEIWRYTVKSLRGERLESVDVLADGFRGDRATRVLGPDGERITGRTAHGLLGLQSGLGDDGEPTIDGSRWDSDEALGAIRSAAGDGATLAPLDRHFDDREILVLTDGAIAALGVDRRRMRPNIVVSGVDGLDEVGWVGKRLRMGQIELDVHHRCERCVMTTIDPDSLDVDPEVLKTINRDFEGCMGVLCSVVTAGELREGDGVELV